MILSRQFVVVLLLALAPTLWGAAAARSQPTRPGAAETSTDYKGAIVMDAATGKVLFEDRADYSGPPASMTKLMTYAVLHDRLRAGTLTLEQPVKIENSDARMGGTQVFLDPRETFSVEELIYAMMIQSANDAAHALARITAGSVPAFVEQMNAKARELGMANTTFRTPHGLPPSTRKVADGDLTTPRDFALLCRYVVQQTDVLKYTSVRNRTFGSGVRAQPMEMKNHNNLLGKVSGVDGLKTGFTAAAGYCLSGTAERNGRRVILVIMGSVGPGGQHDLGRTRDRKAIELIERGFAALPPGPAPVAAAARPPTPRANSAAAAPNDLPSLTPAPAKSAPAPAAPAADTGEPVIRFSLPKRK